MKTKIGMNGGLMGDANYRQEFERLQAANQRLAELESKLAAAPSEAEYRRLAAQAILDDSPKPEHTDRQALHDAISLQNEVIRQLAGRVEQAKTAAARALCRGLVPARQKLVAALAAAVGEVQEIAKELERFEYDLLAENCFVSPFKTARLDGMAAERLRVWMDEYRKDEFLSA